MTKQLVSTALIVGIVGLGSLVYTTPSERTVIDHYAKQDAKAELQRMKDRDPDFKVQYEENLARQRAAGYVLSDDDSDVVIVRVTTLREARSVVGEFLGLLDTPLRAATVTTGSGEAVLKPFASSDVRIAQWNNFVTNFGYPVKVSYNTKVRSDIRWDQQSPTASGVYLVGGQPIYAGGLPKRPAEPKGLLDYLFPVLHAQGGINGNPCPVYFYRSVSCQDLSSVQRAMASGAWGRAASSCVGFGVTCAFTGTGYLPCVGGGCLGSFATGLILEYRQYVLQCLMPLGWCQGGRNRCCVQMF